MGAQPHKGDTLFIDEDMAYQRVFWIIQRGWWALLAVLLVAAVAGVFGAGALSSTSATDGGLAVDYQRFLRKHSVSTLEVTVPAVDGRLEVAFSRAYVDRVEVEGITPEPDSVAAGTEEVVYTFMAAVGDDRLTVEFRVRPQVAGRLKPTVSTAPERVSFTQYVYP